MREGPPVVLPWRMKEKNFRILWGLMRVEPPLQGPLPKTFLGRPLIIIDDGG